MRNRHVLLMDVAALLLLPLAAVMLRVDSAREVQLLLPDLLWYTIAGLAVRLIIFRAFGLYEKYWQYAGVGEVLAISAANFVSMGFLAVISFSGQGLGWWQLPRSIPFIEGALTFIATASIRFSAKLAERSLRQSGCKGGKRVLLVGAGRSGSKAAEEMKGNPQLKLDPICFLDDDERKQGTSIHGLPVVGALSDLPEVVKEYKIEEVIIAMPEAHGARVREVLESCRSVNVPARTVPGLGDIIDGRVSVTRLRPVEIEDLLRREPIRTDLDVVREHIRGKRVLITGAGGSIGSELCRQVYACNPAEIVLLGHGENSIFAIHGELSAANAKRWQPFLQPAVAPMKEADGAAASGPGNHATAPHRWPENAGPRPPVLHALIADVRHRPRLERIFATYRPEVVFHAAAHKHVPLMEANPGEAVTNNVLGTRNLVEVALAHGVQQFVMISTDKAVNPTSVMGVSKRVAELLVLNAARRSRRAYQVVRFGNVLGSRGSVVLTFKEQIARGGPVTVSHPKMCRYFMTIPEAVQLVLQAAVHGQGGEVFVLKMGDPVSIMDLARDLIRLSGFTENEIPIVFSGVRPGEKLTEELHIEGETYDETCHEHIMIAVNASTFIPNGLDAGVEALRVAAEGGDQAEIYRAFLRLVPTYQPNGEQLPSSSAGTVTARH